MTVAVRAWIAGVPSLLLWLVAAPCAFVLPLPGAEVGRADTGYFATEVQPVLQQSCVACHGAEKKKAGLRLDSHEAVMRGGEAGPVVVAGSPERSELYRRITLPDDDEEVMPSDGKKLLGAAAVEVIAAWIRAGAALDADGPRPSAAGPAAPAPPAAPDYRPFLPQLRALQEEFPIRLVPVSQNPTDGLVLRTVSAPQEVDDAVVARLAPVAVLVVDAELSRTRVSDAGVAALAGFVNLRRLDLSHTGATSAGLEHLEPLQKLEWLNVVGTAVDASARATLARLPALRALHAFGTPLAVATGSAPSTP